jgi:TolB protein
VLAAGCSDDPSPPAAGPTTTTPPTICGSVVAEGAVPEGVLAWSDDDEDVFVDDLGDDSPATRLGEPGVRDLDPDLAPSGAVAWRRGPDPDSDAADIVVDGDNLTDAPAEDNWGPAWSPDGRRLAFSSTRGSGTTPRVWTMAPDGTDRRLVTDGHGEYPDWSPDGALLVFAAPGAGGRYDLYVVEASGGEPVRITDDPDTEFFPAWSPRGDWIAFHRLDAGVFVVRPDGTDERRVSPDADAGDPVWAPDGRLGWSGPDGFSVTDLTSCTTVRAPDLQVGRFPSWSEPPASR